MLTGSALIERVLHGLAGQRSFQHFADIGFQPGFKRVYLWQAFDLTDAITFGIAQGPVQRAIPWSKPLKPTAWRPRLISSMSWSALPRQTHWKSWKHCCHGMWIWSGLQKKCRSSIKGKWVDLTALTQVRTQYSLKLLARY
jgi:hypothetical protein